MTTSKTAPVATVRLRRTLNAPIDKVFKAWTEPEVMRKWFGCDQMTDLNVTQDFRVGGNYSIDMICGDTTMHITGVFKEIEVNKKLVYTWTSDFPEVGTSDSLLSVQFIDKGGSTEIVLDHSKFDSDKCAQGHEEGWTYSLGTLAKVFAAD